MVDDMISVGDRQVFPGPLYETSIEVPIGMSGMRHNGQRWVDAERPDPPGVVAIPQETPQQWSDLVTSRKSFGTTKKVRRPKSRRRGGF